jgi:hypothetical protein
MKKIFTLVLIMYQFHSFAQIEILPEDARLHVGDSVSISGIVYGGHYFETSPNKTTMLYLGDSAQFAPLILLIDGADKSNFSDTLLEYYLNKNVIVSGNVNLYRGEPVMKIVSGSQISIKADIKDSNNLIQLTSGIIDLENLDTYDGCAPIGQTSNPVLEELNKQKNRYNIPLQTDFNSSITLNSILAPGNDENRWNVKTAVELTGYVAEVKPGGAETCNCKVNDDAHTDTHIVLIADPQNNQGSKRVIVEVTPRMRFIMGKNGIDWNTATLNSELLGHWIKIKGWLFFDLEHSVSAENTNPGNAKNWRATAWEVHPITSIEVVDHP